jgi:hypothetical protein
VTRLPRLFLAPSVTALPWFGQSETNDMVQHPELYRVTTTRSNTTKTDTRKFRHASIGDHANFRRLPKSLRSKTLRDLHQIGIVALFRLYGGPRDILDQTARAA